MTFIIIVIIINDCLSNSHCSPLSRLLGFTIWSLPISVSWAWSSLDGRWAGTCLEPRERKWYPHCVQNMGVQEGPKYTPSLSPLALRLLHFNHLSLEKWWPNLVNGRTSRAENWWNLELEQSFQDSGSKKAGILEMGYEETMNWFQPMRKNCPVTDFSKGVKYV